MSNAPKASSLADDRVLPYSTEIHRIKAWFEKAVPLPAQQNMHFQTGLHIEEISEMFEALKGAGSAPLAKQQLTFARDVMNYVQRHLKSGEIELSLEKLDRTALLGALCGQIITAVGTAHMFGMDIEGALQELTDSDDSKLDDNDEQLTMERSTILNGQRRRTADLTAYAALSAELRGNPPSPTSELADLEDASIDDLHAMLNQLDNLMNDRRQADKKETLDQIKRLTQEHELTFEEVTAAVRTTTRRGKAPALYRNPDNPRQTWSGKGEAPTWFSTHPDPESLRIPES